ncbi:MAG: hypothetical protein LQ339_005011 [Xanthoria mediterranea]|nr:MAG: hypothetical protein LQ339_005011 [Xanthoria mediterranea]
MDPLNDEDPPPSFDLLRLPPEIILRVIKQLHHEDLENTSLTSKNVLELAKHRRHRHLESKKKYRTLILGDTTFNHDEIANNIHPAFTLRDMLRHKETMSDYCRILKIGGTGYPRLKATDNYYNDAVLVEARALEVEIIHELNDLLGRKSFSNPIDVKESRKSKPVLTSDKDGLRYGMACAWILALLREVQVLELVRCSLFMELEQHNFRKMWRYLSAGEANPPRPLSKVQEVRLIEDEDGNITSLRCLYRLLDLPNVRRIYCHHVGPTLDDDIPLDLKVSWPSVEELRFEISCINGSNLERIVRGTRALKSFRYQIGWYDKDSYDEQGSDSWSSLPKICIHSLRKSALSTLEHFSLTDPYGMAEEDERGIGLEMDHVTLHDFDVLKYVAVECWMFVDDGIDSPDPDAPLDEGVQKENEGGEGVSRLVDVLPRSLEALVLYTPRDANDLAALFRGLLQLKEERLPKLRSISIRRKHVIEQWIISKIAGECQQLGINFRYLDPAIPTCIVPRSTRLEDETV